MKMLARCLVTGAAGFIGSHLSEALVRAGHDVLGIDAFTGLYPTSYKSANISALSDKPRFTLRSLDLCDDERLPRLLDDREFVFHLAGEPGVRGSWGAGFDSYLRNNILATQRLLSACLEVPLRKFVFASSSSVYGDAEAFPTSEETLPQPVSPYGVTKLAAEKLCEAYGRSCGLPVVCLRFFTVYGPRQRPDMAFHKFIRAVQHDQEVTVYGDGKQIRDFTFVADVVEAATRAAFGEVVGRVFNVGGGSPVTVNDTLAILSQLAGRPARVIHTDTQRGDARHTAADTTKARLELGFSATVPLERGLAEQYAWQRQLLEST